MKTTRTQAGIYTVTGHTKAGDLVQYEVERWASWWAVTLLCGKGENLLHLYPTKAAAVQAIANQG